MGRQLAPKYQPFTNIVGLPRISEMVKGQADAQAAVKQSGALTAEYLQYLAVTKWDGHLPMVVGSASPFINLSSLTPSISASVDATPTK